MRFRAEQHLRRQSDFQRVRDENRRLHCGLFTLWWYARPETAAPAAPIRRLGVVASRAAVGIAVQRARAKRRLREVFRLHQTEVPPGLDLLLVARRSLNRHTFQDAEARFCDACQHLQSRTHALDHA